MRRSCGGAVEDVAEEGGKEEEAEGDDEGEEEDELSPLRLQFAFLALSPLRRPPIACTNK